MLSARAESERTRLTEFFSELHDHAVALEEYHLGAAGEGSAETRAYKEQGHQLVIGSMIDSLAKWLVLMKLVVFKAPDGSRFITSDDPCVRFNPDWAKIPAMLRGGLADKAVEVTVPLAPRHLAYFSWNEVWRAFGKSDKEFSLNAPYLSIPAPIVDELNRRTRFYCNAAFVTQTKELNPFWFTVDKM